MVALVAIPISGIRVTVVARMMWSMQLMQSILRGCLMGSDPVQSGVFDDLVRVCVFDDMNMVSDSVHNPPKSSDSVQGKKASDWVIFIICHFCPLALDGSLHILSSLPTLPHSN